MITQYGGDLPKYGFVTVGVKSSKKVPKHVEAVNTSTFFDYFSVKYLHKKWGHVLCAVPYWLKWDAVNQKLLIPEEALMKCWTQSGAKFVFQPVEISTKKDSHANALIINVANLSVDRFEPHGSRESEVFPAFKYAEMDRQLALYFGKLGVTYNPPTQICPWIGPQVAEETVSDVDGYCAAWSLWYVDMRMTYPDVDNRRLVEQMTLKAVSMATDEPGKLRKYLSRFLSQVYEFMYDEFPQYHKFFTRFEYYSDNPTKEFKAFMAHMNQLVSSPSNLLFDGRKASAPSDMPLARKSSARESGVTKSLLPIESAMISHEPLSPSRLKDIDRLTRHVMRLTRKLDRS